MAVSPVAPNTLFQRSLITIRSGTGSAAGSWAASWIFDVSGSYRLRLRAVDCRLPQRLHRFLGLASTPDAVSHLASERARSKIAVKTSGFEGIAL